MITSIFTLGYFLCAISAIALWIASRTIPEKIAPLGSLLQQMLESRTNRIALIGIWWWIGWHFIGQPWLN
ncbi:MAG: DUF6186 family protein [Candidatus Nanopelagicaceae bacterium]|nr:DUF6186 family protein [Candidatus Nanopelagicaceae bacterium]